ncbi:MAG: YciI family protein [Rouxiella aceris]|uniref:YciI family protein n=1 Tax=Rouxiella aceris TaxID=2703884 RepID=UPI00285090E9|nr:YciI family protein [Rouxiella aceris]MDR3433085.1 YciI family protein [Rouxiella aceris]
MNTTYVIVLTYIRPLEEIDRYIADHVQWLNQGYEAGVFLASGRRVPRVGGVILAHGESIEDLQLRLSRDPFQQHGLASCEIIPFEASKCVNILQGIL